MKRERFIGKNAAGIFRACPRFSKLARRINISGETPFVRHYSQFAIHKLSVYQPLRKAKRKCALFIAQLAGRIILRSKITRRARMNLRSKELTIKGATKRASSMRKIRRNQGHYAMAQLAPRRGAGRP